MEIEDTPLFREARRIMTAGQTKTNFGWRAIIHYGENSIYSPLQVIAVNNKRDYVSAFTDEMTCTLLMPLGKYARRIYPNRNSLQITLVKIPSSEVSGNTDQESGVENERYSATLIDEDRSVIDGQGAEANDEFSLDLTQILEVNFQLFNKSLEQIRLMTVGGVFRQAKVDDLLLSMLTKESSKADVDEERAIEGVDLVPVSNKDKKEQIIITHGTKLVDVPDYLQNKVGIYSAGLGSYIQNKHWFVFPLYDTTQFQERQKTLTIIVLPKKKYSNIERTYVQKGDSLTILMTGETGFKDDSGTQYLNEGNGARFSDASKLLENSATTGNNKAIVSRTKNNSEFISDKRNDGINHTPTPSARITANPFKVYSNLNARNGGFFKGVWQNSDPKLILPGMMTRIIFSDEGEVKEIYGVMQAAEHISHKQGDVNSQKFSNQSILYVFVNRLSKTNT